MTQPSREEIIQYVQDFLAPVAYTFRDDPDGWDFAVRETIERAIEVLSEVEEDDKRVD